MNKIEKLDIGFLLSKYRKLKCLDDDNRLFDDEVESVNFVNNTFETKEGLGLEFGDIGTIAFFKVLPLSALTEPLPDGTVPIVELAKIAGFEDFEALQVKEGSTAYIVTLSDDFTFMVLKSNCDFAICAGKEITFLPNQLQLFEYLYSIHADIYGLIPAGLAIDKTIKL